MRKFSFPMFDLKSYEKSVEEDGRRQNAHIKGKTVTPPKTAAGLHLFQGQGGWQSSVCTFLVPIAVASQIDRRTDRRGSCQGQGVRPRPGLLLTEFHKSKGSQSNA